MLEFGAGSAGWREAPSHRQWLRGMADGMFDFFEAESLDPGGGFHAIDAKGRAIRGETARPLHATARMVHCFAIGQLLGRPRAAEFVDHGMQALLKRHRDAKHGGYFWSFDENGPRERDKLAYGHGFVLLAAASAKCVAHPDADWLLADISDVIEKRFWEGSHGASAEEFREDWTAFSNYRGQNANMHLTEALMAAFEATGERGYLKKAESIADLLLLRKAAEANWQVPEHYDAAWRVDRRYKGSDMFRPAGTTPGHALEWTRLALQLWELGGRKIDGLPEAARRLFEQATTLGWDAARGGFYYTLDWSGAPAIRDRLWWPCCEGVGAAAFLQALVGGGAYEDWYRRIWQFCDDHLIDRRDGGWHPQLDDELQPTPGYFVGRPDLYHALQACLIPLHPTTGSLIRALRGAQA